MRGEACNFAHGDLMLVPKPNLYKTQFCKAFMKKGICPRGIDCQFAHSRSELRRVGTSAADSSHSGGGGGGRREQSRDRQHQQGRSEQSGDTQPPRGSDMPSGGGASSTGVSNPPGGTGPSHGDARGSFTGFTHQSLVNNSMLLQMYTPQMNGFGDAESDDGSIHALSEDSTRLTMLSSEEMHAREGERSEISSEGLIAQAEEESVVPKDNEAQGVSPSRYNQDGLLVSVKNTFLHFDEQPRRVRRVGYRCADKYTTM